MPELAIRTEGLGKAYRIGAAQPSYRTLRETVADVALGPVRRTMAALRGQESADPGPEIWALRDVSFEVKRGEVVGIVGRNGAGKTTLLKVLSRITEPTTGRVGLNGRMGSLLGVGTGFHPELTGRENVFLNGALLGMSRKETVRKFDEIVAFAELEAFLDTPVKRYSSGMYMRLAFAVAAHLEPETLVIDEVLAVGDDQFQKKCLGKIGEVARQGRTVLFVSHNMHAVRKLCTRGIWLEKGAIRKDDAVADVVRDYLASTVSPDEPANGRRDVQDGRIAFVSRWHLAGEEPYLMRPDRDTTVLLDIEVRRRVLGVFFGVALWSESDTLVWAAATHDRKGTTRDLDPGRYRLGFAVGRVALAPGRYHLEVSINTPGGQADHWHASPALTVMPAEATVMPERWRGLLELDYRVDLQRLPEP